MLNANHSILVVVDVQGKLANIMSGRDALFENITLLAESAKILGIPILVTEQLPEKLGPTRAELAPVLADALPAIQKSAFSCCAEPQFIAALESSGKKQVVLCGIEAHICVLQTALELLERDLETYVAADAVSARNPQNKERALERMSRRGAEIIVTESILFEWLRDAARPLFREIRKLLA